MVVIFLPAAAAMGSREERTAAPSRCTVQAPHCAIPQPYLVPVRPSCSRIAHNRGVLGLTLTSSVLPLIVKRAMGFPPGIAVVGTIHDCVPEGKDSRDAAQRGGGVIRAWRRRSSAGRRPAGSWRSPGAAR